MFNLIYLTIIFLFAFFLFMKLCYYFLLEHAFLRKKSDDRVEVGRSVRRSSKRISEAIGGVARLKISADSSRKPLTCR